MRQQIAEHLKNYNEDLYFEILNEPTKNLTSDKWNSLLTETITLIRNTGGNNATRKIVIGNLVQDLVYIIFIQKNGN